LEEALFWDDLIQNNFVRASPKDIEEMEPGILFALKGLWKGRNKRDQELIGNKPKTNVVKPKQR
jgi:hypothetical protein